jgi:hypothetical protein
VATTFLVGSLFAGATFDAAFVGSDFVVAADLALVGALAFEAAAARFIGPSPATADLGLRGGWGTPESYLFEAAGS